MESVIAIITCSIIQFVVIYYDTEIKQPPFTIRIAGCIETAFGAILICIGLFIDFVENNFTIAIFFILLGFVWIYISVCLYKARNWARLICLSLSIIRIFTIFGLIFSIPSICLLYYPKAANDFFRENNHN